MLCSFRCNWLGNQYSNLCTKYEHPASICCSGSSIHSFGPVVGFFVGFIGHALKDSIQYGPWWSWILASGVFGLVVGVAKSRLRIQEGILKAKNILVFNVFQIVANIVSWGIIAPVLDIVIYSEPANKVFVQGLVAGIANSVTVAIAGTILLVVYARTQVKSGSLSKD